MRVYDKRVEIKLDNTSYRVWRSSMEMRGAARNGVGASNKRRATKRRSPYGVYSHEYSYVTISVREGEGKERGDETHTHINTREGDEGKRHRRSRAKSTNRGLALLGIWRRPPQEYLVPRTE